MIERTSGISAQGTRVPFNRPHVTGKELHYISEAVANSHLSGNGPFTRRCTELLERELGSGRVLLTHSGTGALEMAMLLAEIGPGDEVILPSFAFSSLANAVVLRGGTPVFVDIREDTLNLDEGAAEAAINPRTRVLAPIDYAGVGCEIEAVVTLARAHGLLVVEDAAQGYRGSHVGRPLGAHADLACLSFHETKNVMCGEGGALVVNRPEMVERAEIIQEKGTDRSKFFRGQVDKYTWTDIGSSFVLSDLAAAFLWAQLEDGDEITSRRMAIWRHYHAALADMEAHGRLRRPIVPPNCAHNAHIYYVLLAEGTNRTEFIRHLADRGVNTVFHYVPLHSSPAGLRFGRVHGSMSVTDSVGARLLRLPLWVGMRPSDIDHVVESMDECLELV